jgi:hypothetical protein
MADTVPIGVLLRAAGLKSARTLVDLVPHLSPWLEHKGLTAPAATDAADPDALEVAGIASDDEGATAPEDQSAPAPAAARGRCLDAAWGYKTSKSSEKEVGFGFHQHTICRVPDPNADDDAEPVLIDGFVLTPPTPTSSTPRSG